MKIEVDSALSGSLQSSSGQSTLEFVLIIPVVLIVFAFSLVATGMVLHLRWVNYNGQHSLVCMALGKSTSACRAQLEHRLRLSPFATQVAVSRASHFASVGIQTLAFKQSYFFNHRELRW